MRGQLASIEGALIILQIEMLTHRAALGDRAFYVAEVIREARRMCHAADAAAEPPADPSHALLLQLAQAQALNLRALSLMARAQTLLREYAAATSSQDVRGHAYKWAQDFDRWMTAAEAQP